MTENPRIAADGEEIAGAVPIADSANGQRFEAVIDASPLVGVKVHKDGYLAATVRAARTGVQTYLASEVGLTGDNEVRIYRPLGEVMRLDSVASYKGKPITDEHPGERVTSDNWASLSRGTIMAVRRRADDVELDIVVSDKALVEKIRAGSAKELSAGYVANIDWTPGIAEDGTPYDGVQRDIYVDHLAVVPVARAGSDYRIGDTRLFGARPTNRHENKDKETTAMADTHETTVMVGDGAVPTTEAGAIRIKALQDNASETATKLADAETKLADVQKQIEAKDGEIAALKKQVSDATSPKALSDAAKARAKVMEAGKKYGMSEEDMDEMDDAAIRRAVVTKALGDEAKNLTDAGVEGAFPFAVKGLAGNANSGLADGIRTQDADPWAFMKKEAK